MGWFSKRSRNLLDRQTGELYAGEHRSPGLALVSEYLSTHPDCSVLDMGASSPENLEFLSSRSKDVVILDAFHKAGAPEGDRTQVFTFDSADEIPWPTGKSVFDVVLAWDLLHYLDRRDRQDFAQELAERTRPGALVLLHASAIAPVPPTPIHFKIVAKNRLEYTLGNPLVPTPELHTRTVERAMQGFDPHRAFQLRNGLQEILLLRSDREAGKADAKAKVKAEAATESS